MTPNAHNPCIRDSLANQSTTLHLRVAPVASAEVVPWRSMLLRLPAMDSVKIDGYEDDTVAFTVVTGSISRTHAQLRHLAETMHAMFEPGLDGTLALTLFSGAASSRAVERAAQWRRASATTALA